MELRSRLSSLVRTVPPAQLVAIGVGLLVLAMAGVLFVRWVTTPSYTVLYSGLEGAKVQAVIDELEAAGASYRLEAAGSRILVPRSEVYRIRAELASAGVEGSVVPEGFELLDEQGLTVSDFQQRVNYQRALEGELARTLMAMEGIEQATVHLVIPERPLFEEDRQPATASVLVAPSRPLTDAEVETVVFLVSSSVPGLEAGQVTVADVSGNVLHAAGEAATAAGLGSRNLRQVREFEAALATDLRGLLESVLGVGNASVVVRAELDFDQRSVESETFGREEPPTIRSQSSEETFTGSGVTPGAAVGVDGGVVASGEGDYDYSRSEELSEYGVDRVVSSVVEAPGKIDRLSVAVVVDEAAASGEGGLSEIESLVAAAVGLDPARGDVVEVSAMAFPDAEAGPAHEPLPEADGGWIEWLPEAAGGLVLAVVAITLLAMTRGGRRSRSLQGGAPVPAQVEAIGPGEGPVIELQPAVHDDVIDLVQRQPEEIATLLRSWLADRR